MSLYSSSKQAGNFRNRVRVGGISVYVIEYLGNFILGRGFFVNGEYVVRFFESFGREYYNRGFRSVVLILGSA